MKEVVVPRPLCHHIPLSPNVQLGNATPCATLPPVVTTDLFVTTASVELRQFIFQALSLNNMAVPKASLFEEPPLHQEQGGLNAWEQALCYRRIRSSVLSECDDLGRERMMTSLLSTAITMMSSCTLAWTYLALLPYMKMAWYVL